MDSAVALAPHKLAGMVEDSLPQYCDTSSGNRQAELRRKLEAEANAALLQAVGPETLARIRGEVEEKLDELQFQVELINESLSVDPDEVGVTTPDVPACLEPVTGQIEPWPS